MDFHTLNQQARFVRLCYCFVFTVLCLRSIAPAEESNTILLRSKLPRSPTLITVNVDIGSESSVMVVDTGAAEIMFDESLRACIKEEAGIKNLFTPNGIKKTKLYESDDIKIQSLVISRPKVVTSDMRDLSRWIGPKIRGVLGVPGLAFGKFFLNYDDGVFEIHSGQWKLSKPPAHEIDLVKDETPSFDAKISDKTAQFSIDTGSDGCIALEQSLFTSLVKQGWIEPTNTNGRTQSAAGLSTALKGWFLKGELMGKSLRGVSVDSNSRFNTLGVQWLWGFNTEIDFSSRKLRYQMRANSEPPMHIQMMVGAIFLYDSAGAIVEKLRPGGGAAVDAGLQLGDTIEVFDILKGSQLNAVTLSETVTANAGKTIQVRFHRKSDNETVNTTMKLPTAVSVWNFAGRDVVKVE